MTANGVQTFRPSMADRIGIIIFMLLGLGIVVWGAVSTVLAIGDIVGGETLTAKVGLIDTTVDVPVGDTGQSIAMEVDTALVGMPEPGGPAVGLAIAAALARLLVITVIVACLTLLARNSLRGLIFSRGNTRLVTATGLTALVGFGIVSVLERMVGNTIIATLSNGQFDNFAVVSADPLPFVLLAFAFGIVATAYTIGARMQRDQEGLV